MRLAVRPMLMLLLLGCSAGTPGEGPRDPPDRWPGVGLEHTATSDARVVAVAADGEFEATLYWPVGWLDEGLVCVALRAWTESTRNGRPDAWLDQTVAPGVTVDKQLHGSCGPHHASVTFRGPAQSSVAGVEHVLENLREPTIASPTTVMAAFTIRSAFDVRRVPIETALRGGQPPLAEDWPPDSFLRNPRGEVDREPALLDALRFLGSQPADLRYAGPATAAELASLLPGKRQGGAPSRAIRPPRDTVLLWPTVVESVTSLVIVGPEWRRDDEGFLQLFEALLRVTALEESVDLDVQVVRPLPAGPSHLVVSTRLNARTAAAEAVDLARRLLAPVPVGRFERALADARDELQRRPDPGDFAIELGGDLDRGLPHSRRQEAREPLRSVSKAEFDAYLQQWTRVPVTWVATGSHADFDGWIHLGAVARFEGLRGPSAP